MPNRMIKLLKLVSAGFGIIVVGGLGACSSLSESYPSVSEIQRITQKILTPQERKQAIDEMTLENDQLRAKTIEKIEKH